MINEAQSKLTRSILLIGSTVEGKKCLTRFLYDQDTMEHSLADELSGKSEIQSLNGCMHSDEIEKFHLNIIDIPGFTKNGSHISRILKHFKDSQNTAIVACVVVIDFNSNIDQLIYKETVKYYANFFPSLFEQNVIIVMIDYATDKWRSKVQGLDIERVKLYTVDEVVDCASLSYHPQLFVIKLLEKEIKKSVEVRNAILKHFSSCKPLSMADETLVSKPRYLFEMHIEKAKKLEEEIAALDIETAKCKEKQSSKESMLPQLETDLTLTNKKVEDLQKQIEEHDNSELVVADTWCVDSEWRLLKRCTGSFNLHSDWIIDSVEQTEEGSAKWTFSEKTEFCVAGTVVGRRNKPLHASLTIKTKKRQKYATDISNWQSQLGEVVQVQEAQQESLEKCQKDIQDCDNKLQILLQFIQMKQDLVTKLSSPNMTIDDAIEELDEIL